MKITNKLNLPQPFVDAVTKDYREIAPNEFSITEMNKGVKEIILSRRHREDIEVDAVEMFWAVFGTAFHSVMEKGKLADPEISESVLRKTFTIDGKEYILSGKFDVYNAETFTVTDWKTSMIYSIQRNIADGADSDWYKQQRGYWLLLNSNGFKCSGAEIAAMARDWSIGKVGRERDYPESPITKIRYDFTHHEVYIDAMEFYTKKFELINQYIDVPDDDIPECLADERWEKKEHWCIWREGNKRPTSYHFTKEEAEFAMETLVAKADGKGKPYSVQFYEQKPAKCVDYCKVNKFCHFYQGWISQHQNDEEEE